MRGEVDGMLLIRAELCDRLESLRDAAERLNMREFVAGVSTIRTIAGAYGMVPVVCVAEAFERAVRAEPRGCPAGLYFERLRDAIGCGAGDERAGEAMLASISVRLSA